MMMMMIPFNCSYRNKNEPTAIYPSLGSCRKEIGERFHVKRRRNPLHHGEVKLKQITEDKENILLLPVASPLSWWPVNSRLMAGAGEEGARRQERTRG
jgi:hypothetical protein